MCQRYQVKGTFSLHSFILLRVLYLMQAVAGMKLTNSGSKILLDRRCWGDCIYVSVILSKKHILSAEIYFVSCSVFDAKVTCIKFGNTVYRLHQGGCYGGDCLIGYV